MDLSAEVIRLRTDKIDRALDNFREAMREKLIKNIAKSEWTDMPLPLLIKRLQGEICELEVAIAYEGPDAVIKESADVANFALFVHDRAMKEKADAYDARRKKEQEARESGAVSAN